MDNETKNPANRKKRPILTTLCILFVFLIIAVILIFVLPPMALRYVFSRVEAESGIAITFGKAYMYLADGSFLYIEGLTVKRQNHHSSNIDLKIESVRMPAMVPSDFRSPVLLVSGLRGTIERVGNDPVDAGDAEHKETTAAEKTSIGALMLVDSEVLFIDRTLEKPFQATLQVESFAASSTDSLALFEPYICAGTGQIGTAKFGISYGQDGGKQRIELVKVPFGLLSPYAPVLDDIFVSGSMNIRVDESSDETQKQVRISIQLQSDCEIKSANEIIAPAIQAALRQLDQSSMPELRDLKGRIERLKTPAESVRGKLDEITQIIDRLSFLVPREVREEYEKIKSQYDRAMENYGEWNNKFETLLQELDQVKVRIVEDTFRAFINSGIPIEIDLQEVNGEWQYDGYAVVIGLIERNYRAVIIADYQKRIQDIRDAVDRLIAP